jgi:hypothetical protein
VSKPKPVVLERQRYTLEQTHPNVHTFRFDDISAGWEQWVLLRSDAHHDNRHCDWDFERKHLDEARARNAIILDGGDLFCAMQGKYDPRSSMDDLRPEHKRTDYLDALVSTAADFYQPYARQFAILGRGNHETNITRRHGTDLTDALARKLREAGGNVYPGGYGGWVRFLFNVRTTFRTSKRLKYYHGAGGGGPVTRGTIQTNRQAVYLPDADVVWNGHTHDAYVLPIQRERLNDAGRIQQDCVWYVRTPGYKDEYDDGATGWHVERGAPPKPIGACWMRFYLERGDGEKGVGIEFTQAIR